ncbi:MAG: hypothetical protein PVH88_22240 [Ignavibacteria bacterium]|jgi:Tol biopolymer transport system component
MKTIIVNHVSTISLFLIITLTSCGTTDPEDNTNYHNKILFASSRSGIEQLYMMNPDGSDIKQITSGEFSHGGGRWSPDASRIVAGTNEEWSTACYSHMVLMNSNGTNRQLLNCGSRMSWSPDGEKIAFIYLPSAELGDKSRYVYVLNVSDYKYVKITKKSGLIVGNPCWSSDGNYIYFSSNEHDPLNNKPEIYEMNNDGTNIVRLTVTPNGYSTSPSISPDGTMIAFVTKREGLSTPAIFIMNIDASDQKKIIESPSGEVFNYPRWSSDASALIFVSGLTDGSAETLIYTVNIDGTNLKKIISDDNSANSPDWSK